MKLFSHSSKNGFSLVEVLIALVILVVVILGGGMYFFYGRLGINREGYRRAALEAASQRLEKLKAATWNDIAPESGDTSDGYTFDSSIRYYLLGSSGWSWIQPAISEDDPPEEAIETATVGNLSDGKMLTEAQYQDNDNDNPPDSYDYLKITVTVSWGDNPDNKVELVTLIAPSTIRWSWLP